MTFWKWAQVAASNSNADSTVNWAEGQAPSTINDSARGMMAAAAKYRDDMAGAIVTGGTLNGYSVSSFQGFDTLAHLNGQAIAFTPHTTNGATVTLSVDGLAAKPLRPAPGIELQSGVLIQGTPYMATYNNSDGVFYLRGVGAAPGIPLGAGFDYWGATTPSTYFAFPTGQAISRSTYAALFALLGTTYGVGDGSTTFNLPDKTGRVSAMKEAAATRLTSTGSGVDGGSLGANGGNQKRTLAANQIPTITSINAAQAISATVNTPSSRQMPILTDPTETVSFAFCGTGANAAPAGNKSGPWGGITSLSGTTNNSISTTYTNASQQDLIVIPPLIVCNYIIRVL